MNIQWGAGQPRRRTSPSSWNAVRTWNRKASASGEFWSVFANSLSDVFDNEVPQAWRDDFWALVRECTSLTFLVLTKRIGNVRGMLPADWGDGYPNVWIGISVVNQVEADRDIPKLMNVRTRLRWLSMEPLLGPIDLRAHMWQTIDGQVVPQANRQPRIDWVIAGGESGTGPEVRPMHEDWVRLLRDQCKVADVPFMLKQWGEHVRQEQSGQTLDYCYENSKVGGWVAPNGEYILGDNGLPMPGAHHFFRLGKSRSGRLLDGVLHDGHPAI